MRIGNPNPIKIDKTTAIIILDKLNPPSKKRAPRIPIISVVVGCPGIKLKTAVLIKVTTKAIIKFAEELLKNLNLLLSMKYQKAIIEIKGMTKKKIKPGPSNHCDGTPKVLEKKLNISEKSPLTIIKTLKIHFNFLFSSSEQDRSML